MKALICLAAALTVLTSAARAAEVPEDAVVIGGESVYRQLLPRCSTVYLTRIFAAPPAARGPARPSSCRG